MPVDDPGDGVVEAVGFVDSLRRAGVSVPLTGVQAFVEALGHLDLAERSSWYWAGRATLVRRESERAVFDAAFARFFDRGPAPEAAGPPVVPVESTPLILSDGEPRDARSSGRDERGAAPESSPWSAIEVLSDKDFARYSDDEWAEASRLMDRLTAWGPRRRSRRHLRTAQPGGAVDHRQLVRQAARHDGELVSLPRRRRATTPRRVVLLLDVSRSMDPYRRAYLRFAHAAVAGRRRVEVFSIGTRLIRLTRRLADRDADRALAAVGPEARDWSGGTRLGDGLHRFNQEWGVPGMARGAAVVLFSDGWEQGEVDLLSGEMARLARVAHEVVWVNPLKATDGYEPRARGMAAALPHLDRFVEGHSLRSLVDLVDLIDHAGPVRRGSPARAGVTA